MTTLPPTADEQATIEANWERLQQDLTDRGLRLNRPWSFKGPRATSCSTSTGRLTMSGARPRSSPIWTPSARRRPAASRPGSAARRKSCTTC